MLAKIVMAEDAGQEDHSELTPDVLEIAEGNAPDPSTNWCCAKHVLTLQQDFLDKKPMLQTYIKDCGHACLFLLKFHCELNAIELYWGFGKYHKLLLIFNPVFIDFLLYFIRLSQAQ